MGLPPASKTGSPPTSAHRARRGAAASGYAARAELCRAQAERNAFAARTAGNAQARAGFELLVEAWAVLATMYEQLRPLPANAADRTGADDAL